ncbi:MAG: M48 family metallopeptidase [Blastocatellia bacterium]
MRARIISLTVLAMAGLLLPAMAQAPKPSGSPSPAQGTAAKPPVSAPAAQTKTPLAEDENPEMIGKRNINKHQINFYSYDKEVAVGRQFAQEVDREAKLVDDPIIAEYINRVGQNLVLHSDAKVPFTIKVLDTDEINAFALPGGFFYVNKGLILAADNEAEVAGVMCHEIAHVAARHGVEQASKGQLVNWGSLPLMFLGGWGGFAARQVAGLAIPMGFLKFSRGAEEEADKLGVQYLWASGYDPSAMGTFFEKLLAKEKKKPGTMARLFSTHPVVTDRIDRVNMLVARFPDRNEYTVNTSDFTTAKNRLIALTNRANPSSRMGTSSDRDQSRPTLKRRQPGSPDATGTEGGTTTEEQKPADRPTLRRAPNGTGNDKP